MNTFRYKLDTLSGTDLCERPQLPSEGLPADGETITLSIDYNEQHLKQYKVITHVPDHIKEDDKGNLVGQGFIIVVTEA
jgi:hypothetical protein